MKDLIDGYVKRVRELVEHVRGNEQATKQSLVGPLFTLLGYDLTDPRECLSAAARNGTSLGDQRVPPRRLRCDVVQPG